MEIIRSLLASKNKGKQMIISKTTIQKWTPFAILSLLAITSLGLALYKDNIQAFATTLVGIGAIYIGLIQWRSNQAKVTLDYYSRRYAVYDSMQTAWGHLQKHKIEDSPALQITGQATDNTDEIKAGVLTCKLKSAEAKFLFDDYIADRVDAYYKKLLEVISLEAHLCKKLDHMSEQTIEKVIDKIDEEKTALYDTLEEMPELLSEYMDIKHII